MIKPIVITDKKREGRGFSLKEIKEAKIDIQRARKLGFLVDRRRKTIYEENIQKLKELLMPVKKKLVKEKIKKVEKPIKKEAKEKKVKKKAEEPKKKVTKPKKKVKKEVSEKKKPKKAVKEKKIKEITLTAVKGLGKKTAESLEKADIKSANKLLSLETKEIAEKTGMSEKKIERLKDSAKEVL